MAEAERKDFSEERMREEEEEEEEGVVESVMVCGDHRVPSL